MRRANIDDVSEAPDVVPRMMKINAGFGFLEFTFLTFTFLKFFL
jgi:hypothetical protein